MNMVAYLITNTVNGKMYVGITRRKSIYRWRQHVKTSIGGSQYALHRAIRKYGESCFTMEEVYTATSVEELHLAERQLIAQYDSMNPCNGYNMTSGGLGVSSLSKASRIAISTSQKARMKSLSTEARGAWINAKSIGKQGSGNGDGYVGVRKTVFNNGSVTYTLHVSRGGIRFRKSYMDPASAAADYDRLALHLYGAEARLNIPNDRAAYLSEDLEKFATDFRLHKRPIGRRPKSVISPESLIKNNE